MGVTGRSELPSAFCSFETGSYVVLAGIPTPYVAEAGLELLDFLPSRC